MKKLLKIIVVLVIAIIMCVLVYIYSNKKSEYTKNIYYMDTYINVKIYTNNRVADNALSEVENIYKEYHELTDRYNHYDGLINVYDIYNNNLEDETLTIDSKLYDVLEYANDWNKKYSKFNIQTGNIIDVWKKYRDSGEGIPTMDELKNLTITELVLLGDNKILNNHPNLDLGSIAKGYATEVAGDYLESVGVDAYLINAGGNVKAGNTYDKEYYKIGVQSPVQNNELLTIINGTNISVVSSGGYERNYVYNGKTYHHIIDPDTLFPSEYMKGVTVVTKDSALGDLLSTTLFLMSVEDGQQFIKDYDVEVIWYTNDNEIVRSENFSNYE